MTQQGGTNKGGLKDSSDFSCELKKIFFNLKLSDLLLNIFSKLFLKMTITKKNTIKYKNQGNNIFFNYCQIYQSNVSENFYKPYRLFFGFKQEQIFIYSLEDKRLWNILK